MKSIRQNIFRRAKGQKIKTGILVSRYDEAEKKFYIGFSLCMKTDKFDAELAEEIATGRTGKACITIPHSIIKDVDKFIGRCSRYYKDAELGTCIVEPNTVVKG